MTEKCGLVLVNLGSPDAPTPDAVRRYLFEFLHDYRVIDTNRWIWCPILHGIILRVRPKRSARNYAKIWDQPDGRGDGEAPLIRITRTQAEAVQAHLGRRVVVDVAMRYGNPSVALAVDRLMAQGITKIAFLPLYPQYAGATTASVYDAVYKTLKTRANVPDIRLLRDYHQNEDYINALAISLRVQIETQGWEPEVILASFHGLPQSYVDKGDPYAQECQATVEKLRDAMDMDEDYLKLTFQSRFGPKKWLQPYTDKTIEQLAKDGVKRITIITPGFAADCLETLEEINMEVREIFMEAGGEKFSMVPCLNAGDNHTRMLANIAKTELLAGWL